MHNCEGRDHNNQNWMDDNRCNATDRKILYGFAVLLIITCATFAVFASRHTGYIIELRNKTTIDLAVGRIAEIYREQFQALVQATGTQCSTAASLSLAAYDRAICPFDTGSMALWWRGIWERLTTWPDTHRHLPQTCADVHLPSELEEGCVCAVGWCMRSAAPDRRFVIQLLPGGSVVRRDLTNHSAIVQVYSTPSCDGETTLVLGHSSWFVKCVHIAGYASQTPVLTNYNAWPKKMSHLTFLSNGTLVF
jgi:hypothetical protein